MKTKVVYILTILVLTGLVLKGQKPTFDLLPSGKQQKIPEALVDTKYYNDTAQRSQAMALSHEDSIQKTEKANQAENTHVNRHRKSRAVQTRDSMSMKLFFLMHPSRMGLGISKLFLRVFFNTP